MDFVLVWLYHGIVRGRESVDHVFEGAADPTVLGNPSLQPPLQGNEGKGRGQWRPLTIFRQFAFGLIAVNPRDLCFPDFAKSSEFVPSGFFVTLFGP